MNETEKGGKMQKRACEYDEVTDMQTERKETERR